MIEGGAVNFVHIDRLEFTTSWDDFAKHGQVTFVIKAQFLDDLISVDKVIEFVVDPAAIERSLEKYLRQLVYNFPGLQICQLIGA